ncbi:unnamed protein product [Ectocarpus sp. 8 AP-2014]
MQFAGRQPAADSHKSATATSWRSSRLLGHHGDSSRSIGGGMMGNRSRWARSETKRLVRLQAVVRGWLLRRKVNWIPARYLEAVLKDLDQRDKGLRRLVACTLSSFYASSGSSSSSPTSPSSTPSRRA